MPERQEDGRVQELLGCLMSSSKGGEERGRTTYAGDGLERDKVSRVACGPQEGHRHVDAKVLAEEVDVNVGERLGGAGNAMGEDEGREEDGRDAEDVDEDVLRVGVVRGLEGVGWACQLSPPAWALARMRPRLTPTPSGHPATTSPPPGSTNASARGVRRPEKFLVSRGNAR